MKKAIIILISVLLIIIIAFLVIIELSRYESYTGVITDINSNSIIFDCFSSMISLAGLGNVSLEYYGHKVYREDDVYITLKYQIYNRDSIVVKNKEGKRINFTDLNVGDSISVTIKKPKMKDDFGYNIEPLRGVKVIEVLDNNKQ